MLRFDLPLPLTILIHRQWLYQTCNEFGWYQTSDDFNGKASGFLDMPLSFSLQQCADIFGAEFTPERVAAG
jgi:hypothetical protein